MARPLSSARRYAEAAFAIAQEDRAVEAWLADLRAIAAALADERILLVVGNPTLPIAGRRDLLRQTLAKSPAPKVLNLVSLLLERRRIELFPQIVEEFQRLVDAQNGVVRAVATAASPLSPDEVAGLRERLAHLTGHTVELTTDVDADLLGGVVVRVGDRLIDGSVRGRLERLRSQLVSGAL